MRENTRCPWTWLQEELRKNGLRKLEALVRRLCSEQRNECSLEILCGVNSSQSHKATGFGDKNFYLKPKVSLWF